MSNIIYVFNIIKSQFKFKFGRCVFEPPILFTFYVRQVKTDEKSLKYIACQNEFVFIENRLFFAIQQINVNLNMSPA